MVSFPSACKLPVVTEPTHRDSFIEPFSSEIVISDEGCLHVSNEKHHSECFINKEDVNHQDISGVLKEIRVNNLNRIGHLNVNSLAENSDSLKVIIPVNIDVMVITESKLDDSYPTSQFFIDGFSEPFRLDPNVNGGSVLIYTRVDIPCKQLFDHSFPDDIGGLFVEYLGYKRFDRVTFKKDLKNEICFYTDNINKYLPYENAFLKVLNMHAPTK